MRYLLLGLLLAGVVVSLATCMTLVQPGERAMVRRFGRVLEEKPGPGLLIGLPWGMDRVDRIAVERVRNITVGIIGKEGDEDSSVIPPGQMLTGDHNLVNVQAEIHYKVIDQHLEDFILQADRADSLIARAAESALAEWVAGQGVDDIFLKGKNTLPRRLTAQVQERIEPYRLGVQIMDASITILHPPTEVKPYFDEVVQEQTRIRTQVNQAEQEKDSKLREAEAIKFRIESLTKAYAREQELAARAEAENFLKRLDQYQHLARANPDYLNSLWLDGMTRLYARMRETGRLDVLDHYLSAEGLNITQFPLLPRKK